jgi:helicase
MKMADLVNYGYPKELIRIWEQEESTELLPIQEKAIKEYNVFDKKSGNLLVIGPTSSGKTFIGELAAVKEALEMRKSLYLVPFRAIAEEVYANFVKKYKEYGFRIVISDRDHREFDDDIISGEYEIGVVVYEKLTGLLTANPELLSSGGLVVADEVQMMADKIRGPTIELLLTKILLSNQKVRIVTLSAVLEKLGDFDKWLNAKVLKEQLRPVELREGIYLNDGQILYKEFNSGKEGTEKIGIWNNNDEGLLNLVQLCIEQNEQVLVFCNSRLSTFEHANFLASKLRNISSAVETIKKANDLTDSRAREEIQRLLRAGVAYHNSDLGLEERLLIEGGFREKDIKVICCTSTLAMGVNVPARNVIVCEPTKWERQQLIPLTVAEYKNMVGRAGRYSFHDPYGRSYLIANSPARAEQYEVTYVSGHFEDFVSSFGERDIDEQVLDILTGELAKTEDEVRKIIFSTYSGKYRWDTESKRRNIGEKISGALRKCVQYDAIKIDESGNIKATKAGKLCAAGGYMLEHLRMGKEYFGQCKKDIPLSIIYWALNADAKSSQQAYHIPRLRTLEYNSQKYQKMLVELASISDVGPLLETFANNITSIDYEDCVTLRRCLACYAWISEKPVRQIEADFPGVSAGSIRNTATVCEWLISFLAELSVSITENAERCFALEKLSERIAHGSTEEALSLCRIRSSGLSRDERNHLVKIGIQNIDDVLKLDPSKIPLSKVKITKLVSAAESTIEDDLERKRRFQQTRLRSIGIDASLLNALYEKRGIELELVIDELFKAPFISLTCNRISKQEEGEPDHLLYASPKDIFVIQTTARDRKNVTMTKATSIIGQSSKYTPVGYIVLGRPDFEALAIKDSINQIQAGRNYKLIPLPVLAEMFVLYHEKQLGSNEVAKI